MESTILMMHQFHLSVNREPVGMHIKEAHEDADHHALLVEILILFHFLHHDNLAVSRSYDDVFRLVFLVKDTDRTAEEIDNNAIYDAENCYKAIERYVCLEGTP